MAKTWYPVIDYSSCIECGACTRKCSHGVYDKEKAPSPVVASPDDCVDHCHGCGNLCPVGAITYVGEDTGWTPPNGTKAAEEACSCGCESSKAASKKVLVEYLYLDLETCSRCIGTDSVLDEVMAALTPALTIAGYEVEYSKTEMKTAELAEKHRFISSPTIQVNGSDVLSTTEENSCGCCSDISGTPVDCRVFKYNDESYEVPPKELIAESILRAVFGKNDSGCNCGNYTLPDNLKHFYEGKAASSGCSCGGDCSE